MDESLQPFVAGLALGSILGVFLGYQYGVRKNGPFSKPEARIVIAFIITGVWVTAQFFSLAFGIEVDGWLNAIMGTVAGFFFGDGIVESMKK